MKIEFPNLPTVQELEFAIQDRRGEIAELREMLKLARIRELRTAANPALSMTPCKKGASCPTNKKRK